MKIKVLQRRGILDHRPTVALTLTNPTDIFSFVVGRHALFAEVPQQVVENLKVLNKAALLEFWIMSGLIAGFPNKWVLSRSTEQKVRNNLKIASTLHLGEPKQPQTSLYGLVRKYRDFYKKSPGEVKNSGNIAAYFRRLCKKFPPKLIDAQIYEFFKNRTYPNYSVEQFERFLTIAFAKRSH